VNSYFRGYVNLWIHNIHKNWHTTNNNDFTVSCWIMNHACQVPAVKKIRTDSGNRYHLIQYPRGSNKTTSLLPFYFQWKYLCGALQCQDPITVCCILRGGCGRDHSWIYNYLCNQYLSLLLTCLIKHLSVLHVE
jgi:hypothetical protein